MGLTGEQGNEAADFLKGDEGGEVTPDKGQEITPPASEQGDLAKGSPANGEDQGKELRAELVKRFGEKSDQEYLAEVWKSYRNGETTFSQAQEKAKELESLVSQFGGAEVLRRALENPVMPASAAEKPAGQQYPAKVQPLIDQGLLDPNDPIAQLLIDQERRLEQSQQFVGQATHESAVKTFDTWLKDVSDKYSYADIDVIRDMGLKGAFANMNDAQAQAKINEIAARQHARVQGLIDSKTQAKLDELKGLDRNKVLFGKPGGGKPTALTPRQAFEAKHAEYFKEE